MGKIYSRIDEIPEGRADESITEGCMVLEGGGWRGLYTLGVLDALMQENINLRSTVGISAGALSGLGYLTGQIGWGARVDLRFRHDRNYCGIGAIKRDKGVTGFSYLFKDIMKELPLDKKRFRETSRELAVGVTNMLTGKIEYHEKGKCNMSAMVRASATVPYVSRPVVIGGIPYLDGGCAEKIPFSWAEARGEKKIVIVKTREWDYTRDEDPLMLNDLMYHKYPEFVESMNKANAEFNELNERLKVMHESGEVYVIAPSQPVIVKRFEGDMEKLGDLYWLGFNDAKAQLDAIKGYLGI